MTNTSTNKYISIETGVFGRVPVYGSLFGAAINPISLYSTCDIFDLYDGGIIDVAVSELAETDKYGNVNVSKINSRSTGPGGFINITQCSKKIIFIGTFTAKGLKVEIKKFKNQVSQITYASKYSKKIKQEVLYITERAVFKVNDEGLLTLTEVAPGIDIEKDIINQMEFRPIISENLKLMNPNLFINDKLNLEEKFK